MMTSKDLILHRLKHAGHPLALHELHLNTVSQAAASARLRELKKDGLVVSVPVKGKKFTAWMLTPVSDYDMSQPFMRI